MYATNATIRTTYWADYEGEKTEYKFLTANTLDELYEKMAKLKSEKDEGYELHILGGWSDNPKYGTKTTFGQIYIIGSTLPFDSNALEKTHAWGKCVEERNRLKEEYDAHQRVLKQHQEKHERTQYERLRSKFGE
jgi:hypothetical protein